MVVMVIKTIKNRNPLEWQRLNDLVGCNQFEKIFEVANVVHLTILHTV